MELDTETLQAQAVSLFDQMQRIIENRAVPIIEHYHKDFYEFDRLLLEDKFSANARYLWLIHPNGTHFGRIGVVSDERDFMKAALKSYVTAHPPERMELYSVETDAAGKARVREISFEEGHRRLSRKDYKIVSNVMLKGKEQIAYVDVKIGAGRPGEYAGMVNITSIEDRVLNREEMIAAVMSCAGMVAEQSGLFTPLKSVLIDGHDVDDVLPLLEIPEVTRGQYAPIPAVFQAPDVVGDVQVQEHQEQTELNQDHSENADLDGQHEFLSDSIPRPRAG